MGSKNSLFASLHRILPDLLAYLRPYGSVDGFLMMAFITSVDGRQILAALDARPGARSESLYVIGTISKSAFDLPPPSR